MLTKNSNISLTIVICHFGDAWWLINCIKSNNLLNNSLVKEIIVYDNSNNINGILDTENFSSTTKIRIIKTSFNMIGARQHANSLNLIKNEPIKTSHICILDTDVIFLNKKWLDFIGLEILKFDSIVSLVEGSKCLSHSCFQIIPTSALKKIDFSLGMESNNFDTGRLIGLQLSLQGYLVKQLKVYKSGPFGIGYIYEQIELYHITSVSLRNLDNRGTLIKSKLLKKIRELLLKVIALELVGFNCNNYLILDLRILYKTFVSLKKNNIKISDD